MINEDDIRSMLDDYFNDLHIPKESGRPGFNDWEQQLIERINGQFNRNTGLFFSHGLTDKQLEKLEFIWNKI